MAPRTYAVVIISYGAGDKDAWLVKIRETGAIALETTAADINNPGEISTPGFEIFGAETLMHLRRRMLCRFTAETCKTATIS